jgi:hypothetical protein
MPVSVVVGGQFGSEGKGKVALAIAKVHQAAAVERWLRLFEQPWPFYKWISAGFQLSV